MADAQVVIYTGIGYDDWMDKFIKADSSASTKYVVNVGTDILGKAQGDNPHVGTEINPFQSEERNLIIALRMLNKDVESLYPMISNLPS